MFSTGSLNELLNSIFRISRRSTVPINVQIGEGILMKWAIECRGLAWLSPGNATCVI